MTRGVDISTYQGGWPPAPAGASAWDFAFIRATHDATGSDSRFAQHWAEAAAGKVPIRGAYHYANPAASAGYAQANLFALACLSQGFKPGADLWALDLESNPIGGPATEQWVDDFFRAAGTKLGPRGLLYIGWYTAESYFGANAPTYLRKRPWWLPAYGVNDGSPHDYVAPFVPCLHQYTSRGGPGGSGLDISEVTDANAWHALTDVTAQPPVPVQRPLPPPKYITTKVGDEVHTDISGVKLGSTASDSGSGWVPAPTANGRQIPLDGLVVIGGDHPSDMGHFDPLPVATLTTDQKVIVVRGGVPGGTYTVRCRHAS